MTDDKGTPAFEGWAVVELMGHRRLGGYVREVVVAGAGLLRVEMPEDDGGAALTQFYSPSALYCLTPCTEQTARAALRLSRPEPVSRWDLQRAADLSRPALTRGEPLRCERCQRTEDEGVKDWEVDEDGGGLTGLCAVCAEVVDAEEEYEASDSQADGHRDEPEQGDPVA